MSDEPAIYTGIGASVTAAIGAVGLWLRAHLGRSASNRRAEAEEHAADMEHDAAVAPVLSHMLGELRTELRQQQDAAEARCRKHLDKQSERHERQRQIDREHCEERIEAVERHTGLVTEELIATRRRLRVLERHPRVVDVSEDAEDTGLHRLDESLRVVRRTPTPPDMVPAPSETE